MSELWVYSASGRFNSFYSNQLLTIKSFIRSNIASSFMMPQVILPEDSLSSISFVEPLKLNVAVIWRKESYNTQDAKRFIHFAQKRLESSHSS